MLATKKLYQDHTNFFVVLRQDRGNDIEPRMSDWKLKFKVNTTSIADLWRKSMLENFLLDTAYAGTHLLDKKFMFKGFVTTPKDRFPLRSLSRMCDEMNFAIYHVNERMASYGYPRIDLYFTVEKLLGPEYRDIMNDIHHHFEVLMGQSWAPSKWYKLLQQGDSLDALESQIARWAIGELNYCCHEIESTIEAINHKREWGVGHSACIGLSYSNQHHDQKIFKNYTKYYNITLEHYKEYVPTIAQFGTVTPFYSQLGKTPKEAFDDGDDYIEKENITPEVYMRGETNIFWMGSKPYEEPKCLYEHSEKTGFKAWLEKNGWEIDDPRLALGQCILARIDADHHNLNNPEGFTEFKEKLYRYNNVVEVGFADDDMNTLVSKRYENTWLDQYESILKAYGLEWKKI